MRNNNLIIDEVASITAAIARVSKESLLGRDRRKEVVKARMVFTNIMMNEVGFHYTELEEGTNYDRCTFYYHEGKHRDNYQYWDEYRSLYNEVVASYLGDNSILSLGVKDISTIIKENNIGTDSCTARFLIRFKLGSNEIDIYCIDLTKTIDDINKTFKNFNFTFKVVSVNAIK
jgi:hypothetical protein|tara:strand:- start:8467 stop:8988 length:522 start_codon:yes stop_codon:yes gene_type:complete